MNFEEEKRAMVLDEFDILASAIIATGKVFFALKESLAKATVCVYCYPSWM